MSVGEGSKSGRREGEPLCDDPRNYPEEKCYASPLAECRPCLASQFFGAEDSDVDVLGGDMTVDHTGDDNLHKC